MNKVLAIQNPNTKETSALLVGETPDTSILILSKPDMNRRLGWINCVHDEILHTDFTVGNTIQKDISKIEEKFHKIWVEDKKSYDMNAYLIQVMTEIKLEVDLNFAISTETNELMEEIGISEGNMSFIDITRHISNGRMSPSLEGVLSEQNIDKLVFKFEATDHIGWESVGYCIYDLTSKEMQSYISPVEFFESLENKRYGYCGEIFAHNCMTERDVINEDSLNGIRKAVEARIVEFNDKKAADKRIENALSI